jgi:hypothetical protein
MTDIRDLEKQIDASFQILHDQGYRPDYFNRRISFALREFMQGHHESLKIQVSNIQAVCAHCLHPDDIADCKKLPDALFAFIKQAKRDRIKIEHESESDPESEVDPNSKEAKDKRIAVLTAKNKRFLFLESDLKSKNNELEAKENEISRLKEISKRDLDKRETKRVEEERRRNEIAGGLVNKIKELQARYDSDIETKDLYIERLKNMLKFAKESDKNTMDALMSNMECGKVKDKRIAELEAALEAKTTETQKQQLELDQPQPHERIAALEAKTTETQKQQLELDQPQPHERIAATAANAAQDERIADREAALEAALEAKTTELENVKQQLKEAAAKTTELKNAYLNQIQPQTNEVKAAKDERIADLEAALEAKTTQFENVKQQLEEAAAKTTELKNAYLDQIQPHEVKATTAAAAQELEEKDININRKRKRATEHNADRKMVNQTEEELRIWMEFTEKNLWTEDPNFCCISDIINETSENRNTRSKYRKEVEDLLHTKEREFVCEKKDFDLCVAKIALKAKGDRRKKLADMIGFVNIDPKYFELMLNQIVKSKAERQ